MQWRSPLEAMNHRVEIEYHDKELSGISSSGKFRIGFPPVVSGTMWSGVKCMRYRRLDPSNILSINIHSNASAYRRIGRMRAMAFYFRVALQ
jgi:hypothetical protein